MDASVSKGDNFVSVEVIPGTVILHIFSESSVLLT
jgi:hypothetical protein